MQYGSDQSSTSANSERMFGLHTGNEQADREAGLWLLGLMGVLAVAAPVAFLSSPNLGFKKKKRSVSAEEEEEKETKLKETIERLRRKFES